MKTKRPYKWIEQAVVISAMRKAFRRYPAYKECLDAAKSEYFIKSKHGKHLRRVHWECSVCHKKVNNANKSVDHTIPVIDPIKGFTGYDDYAKRLFCDKINLKVLCKSCHKVKSNEENKIRRAERKRREQ